MSLRLFYHNPAKKTRKKIVKGKISGNLLKIWPKIPAISIFKLHIFKAEFFK